MKILKRAACVVLTLMILVMPVSHISAQAVQASDLWRQAYTTLLRDYSSRGFSAAWSADGRTAGEFILYDIDKDGIPELIVADSFHFTNYLAVYTFREGRMQQLADVDFDYYSPIVLSPSGNRPGIITIVGMHGVRVTSLWLISGNGLVRSTSVEHNEDFIDARGDRWFVDGREVSRAEYDRTVNSVFGDLDRLLTILIWDISESSIRMTIGAIPDQPAISVVLNGRRLSFDTPPQMISGRVMLPLRTIFEEMGAEVVWDGATRTATATKGDTTVVLTIGSVSPTVNGRVVQIDQPGVIVSGRTLAPLRFVAEAFGGQVVWDGESRTATINGWCASVH